MTLVDFAAGLLASRGALVEQSGDALDVVLPSDVARTLGVAEYARLEGPEGPRTTSSGVAGPAVPSAAGTPASVMPSHRLDHESALFESLGRLLGPAGRIAAAELRVPVKAIDAEAELHRAVRLENGIWRAHGAQRSSFLYAGFVLQYDCVADERTSGLVAAWVNAETRSFAAWDTSLLESDSLEPAACDLDEARAVVASCWPLAREAALVSIRRDLDAPLESLARRQSRDLDRVREYYEAIDQDLRRKIARRRGQDPGADLTRLEATGRAFQARARELVERYRARVTATPVAFVVCRVPGHRIDARLHRRNRSVERSFSWNPIDAAIDARACDGCGRPVGRAWLCDEQVHYLCSDCLSACPDCARGYCRACSHVCRRKH